MGFRKFFPEHVLRVKLKGTAEMFPEYAEIDYELDIADEFAKVSRALGYESKENGKGALWQTAFIYDDYSLLAGDFLARGLRLELGCMSGRPIFFAEIFACLQLVLSRLAKCRIDRVEISCWVDAVRRQKTSSSLRANYSEYLAYAQEVKEDRLIPVGEFSRICYGSFSVPVSLRTLRSSSEGLLQSFELPLPTQRMTLADLALPVSALWNQYAVTELKRAKEIKIQVS